MVFHREQALDLVHRRMGARQSFLDGVRLKETGRAVRERLYERIGIEVEILSRRNDQPLGEFTGQLDLSHHGPRAEPLGRAQFFQNLLGQLVMRSRQGCLLDLAGEPTRGFRRPAQIRTVWGAFIDPGQPQDFVTQIHRVAQNPAQGGIKGQDFSHEGVRMRRRQSARLRVFRQVIMHVEQMTDLFAHVVGFRELIRDGAAHQFFRCGLAGH